jgi:hypothetical protein
MTEQSDEARNCTIHYDIARRAVLRAHTWNFARKQISAAMLSAAQGTPENPNGTPPVPIYPWLYEYAWPQDCLRMRHQEIPPPSQGAGTALVWTGNYPPLNDGYVGFLGSNTAHRSPPFAISTDQDTVGNTIKVVLSNLEYATFVYTYDCQDPNMFDASFDEAFIWALAARLCGPLTGDKAQAKLCAQNAEASVIKARVADANELPTPPTHTPDWIRARGGMGLGEAELPGTGFLGLEPLGF